MMRPITPLLLLLPLLLFLAFKKKVFITSKEAVVGQQQQQQQYHRQLPKDNKGGSDKVHPERYNVKDTAPKPPSRPQPAPISGCGLAILASAKYPDRSVQVENDFGMLAPRAATMNEQISNKNSWLILEQCSDVTCSDGGMCVKMEAFNKRGNFLAVNNAGHVQLYPHQSHKATSFCLKPSLYDPKNYEARYYISLESPEQDDYYVSFELYENRILRLIKMGRFSDVHKKKASFKIDYLSCDQMNSRRLLRSIEDNTLAEDSKPATATSTE